MKLEDQVTNPEVSRLLRDAGIRRKSAFIWVFYTGTKQYVLKQRKDTAVMNSVPAYTVAELGQMIIFGDMNKSPVIKISNILWNVPGDGGKKATFSNEASARGFYLYRLIITKEVSVSIINK